MNTSKHTFTFIELLVLIGVFALLTITLLPAMNKTMEDDRKLACINNLKQTNAALIAYSMDFEGYIPAPFASKGKGNARWWSGNLVANKYISDEKVLRCPVVPLVGKSVYSETYGLSRINETGHSDNNFFRNLEKIELPLCTYPIVGDTVAKNAEGTVVQSYLWDHWYSTRGCLGFFHGDTCSIGMADGHVTSWKAADFTKYNKITTKKIYAGGDLNCNKITF
jgi:prepilin-type processing-associated H-X9-DG protein